MSVAQKQLAPRWRIVTSLNDEDLGESTFEGTPVVPEVGSKVTLLIQGNYVDAVVTEQKIEQSAEPPTVTIKCTRPETFMNLSGPPPAPPPNPAPLS